MGGVQLGKMDGVLYNRIRISALVGLILLVRKKCNLINLSYLPDIMMNMQNLLSIIMSGTGMPWSSTCSSGHPEKLKLKGKYRIICS